MARRRIPPDPPLPPEGHTAGRVFAHRDPKKRPPWRIIDQDGRVIAVIHSRRPAADAHRLAIAWNEVRLLDTGDIQGVTTRTLMLLRDLLAMVEGRPPIEGVEPESHRTYTLRQSRRLLVAARFLAPEPEPENPTET